MADVLRAIGGIIFVIGAISSVILGFIDFIWMLGSLYLTLVGALTVAFANIEASVEKLVKLGEAQLAELRMIGDGAKPTEPS